MSGEPDFDDLAQKLKRHGLLHRLGFRFAMPFGTLALPVHVLARPLLLAALSAWLAFGVRAALFDVTTGWAQSAKLFGAAALLGLLLSIPVLAWFVVALGGAFWQGLLIDAGMVLLGAEAIGGQRSRAWLVVPALFFGTWLVQVIGGRIALARLRREIAAFEPLDGRGLQVAIADWSSASFEDLIDRRGVATVYQHDKVYRRLSSSAAAEALRLLGGVVPRGWELRDQETAFLLMQSAKPPPDCPVLGLERRPSPGGLLGSGLRRAVLHQGETLIAETVTGTAAIVARFPLFHALRWMSISPPRASWTIDFIRRSVPVGPVEALRNAADLFAPHPAVAPESALPESIQAACARVQAARTADLAGFWARLAETRQRTHADWAIEQQIQNSPELIRSEDVPVLIAWLKASQGWRKREEVVSAAQYLGSMSSERLAPHHDALIALLNSRTLGMVWTITPDFDPTALPPQVPRFGDEAGFGLIRAAPALYARLAALSPQGARLVDGLVSEARDAGIKLAKELASLAPPPAARG